MDLMQSRDLICKDADTYSNLPMICSDSSIRLEHQPVTLEVAGSIPVRGATMLMALAQKCLSNRPCA